MIRANATQVVLQVHTYQLPLNHVNNVSHLALNVLVQINAWSARVVSTYLTLNVTHNALIPLYLCLHRLLKNANHANLHVTLAKVQEIIAQHVSYPQSLITSIRISA